MNAAHPTSPTATPRRRRLLRWLLAWAALTGIGFALHWAEWIDPSRGQANAAGEYPAIKVLANLQHMITMPAWMIINTLRSRWGVESVGWSLFTLGLAWGVILYLLNGVCRARCRWLRRTTPDPSRAPAATPTPDLSRRRLLTDGALGVGGLLVGTGLARATLTEPWDIATRRYLVPIQDLPQSLDGFRIVQICDTHLGPRIPASHVRASVELALSLKPDLVALTGDYIHMGDRYIAHAAGLFRPLREGARAVPTVGTLGNHDWFGDGREMSRSLAALGVEMIDNQRVFLHASTRRVSRYLDGSGPALCIAGLGDLREDSIDIRGALHRVPEGMPRLVLAHNPDSAEELEIAGRAPPRVDLMLSGHTHGGQVRIPGFGTPFIPSRYGQKYAGGLAQGPHCRVLISRGVGMSIFPVRLGVPPEIVEITLTRA